MFQCDSIHTAYINPLFTVRVLDGVLLGDSTFEFMDEILWCDHSNESFLRVLSRNAICLSKFHKMKFEHLVEFAFLQNLAVN